MRCCNIINSLITGFPPDPVPDPDQPGFLWYAELTGIVWNSNNAVTINGVLADVVFDNPALGDLMQEQYGSNNSGAWMVTDGLAVYIWVYQVDEPVADVVNFDTAIPIPLTWIQGDTLTELCYEATVNVSDPASTNPQTISISPGNLGLEFNVSGASFDNPAIATVLDNIFHQTFGAEANLVVTDMGGGDYLISIQNTLIIPIQIVTTNAETALFFETPCP